MVKILVCQGKAEGDVQTVKRAFKSSGTTGLAFSGTKVLPRWATPNIRKTDLVSKPWGLVSVDVTHPLQGRDFASDNAS